MNKYYGEMKNETGTFDYSVNAPSIFEADKKLAQIANDRGWTYTSVNSVPSGN